MCESKVFFEREGKREMILEDVASIVRQGDEWVLTSLFGEKKTVRGALAEMRLLDHEIIFRPE
ncbi:MAG: CooT family nickel-binding protein [Armatimonadota bacterium]|nr:MAG: CooT family nickel-binding protein [Armatimonadota bacterium]